MKRSSKTVKLPITDAFVNYGHRPTTVDERSSVRLVHVAAFDWLDSMGWVCSSSHPASGRRMVTAVIYGEGRRVTERHTVSDWWRSAVVRSFKAMCWWVISLSDVVLLLPRCWTQRPRPFSRQLSDGSIRSRTLVNVFGRYTNLLSADVGDAYYT